MGDTLAETTQVGKAVLFVRAHPGATTAEVLDHVGSGPNARVWLAKCRELRAEGRGAARRWFPTDAPSSSAGQLADGDLDMLCEALRLPREAGLSEVLDAIERKKALVQRLAEMVRETTEDLDNAQCELAALHRERPGLVRQLREAQRCGCLWCRVSRRLRGAA